jgi:hypothetical protein
LQEDQRQPLLAEEMGAVKDLDPEDRAAPLHAMNSDNYYRAYAKIAASELAQYNDEHPNARIEFQDVMSHVNTALEKKPEADMKQLWRKPPTDPKSSLYNRIEALLGRNEEFSHAAVSLLFLRKGYEDMFADVWNQRKQPQHWPSIASRHAENICNQWDGYTQHQLETELRHAAEIAGGIISEVEDFKRSERIV